MFEKLKTLGKNFRREIKVYQLALKDPRTPKVAKVFLWLALGYALWPFDLIPDFVPVLGQLDDLIIVPLLISLALYWIPREVLADGRAKVGAPE